MKKMIIIKKKTALKTRIAALKIISLTINFLNNWEEKSKEFTKNIENLKLAYKKEHGL